MVRNAANEMDTLGWEDCCKCGQLTCDDQYIGYYNAKQTKYAQFYCEDLDCKSRDEEGGQNWYCINCKYLYLEKIYDNSYRCKIITISQMQR